MERRRFVAACLGVATPAVTGCLAAGGRSQDELPGVSLRLWPVRQDGDATSMAIPEDALSAPQRHLVEAALGNGDPPRAVTYGHEPFDVEGTASGRGSSDDGVYVELGGAFHHVERRTTGSERTDLLVLRAEEVDEEEAIDPVRATAYSRPDRDRIDYAIRREMRRRRVDAEQRRSIPEREWLYVLPDREVIEDHSDLVPEPEDEFVTAYDRHFRLVVEERTLVADEYTWSVREVASDRRDFRTYVEEEVIDGSFDDPPPSEVEAAIVDEAAEDRHAEYRPYSDAFVSLAGRVGVPVDDGAGYETLGGPTTAVVLVEYESRYWDAWFELLEY